MSQYKTIIENITKALVDNPSSVEVKEAQGNTTTAIEIKTAKEDLGKIIGKKGRTISAIRSIVSAIGAKNGQRVQLVILE